MCRVAVPNWIRHMGEFLTVENESNEKIMKAPVTRSMYPP